MANLRHSKQLYHFIFSSLISRTLFGPKCLIIRHFGFFLFLLYLASSNLTDMKIPASLYLCVICLLSGQALRAQNEGKVKVYGDVTTFLTYDSRDCYTAVSGLYNFAPKDVQFNEKDLTDIDLNDAPTVRMSTIATRLGVDWTGFRVNAFTLETKVEADFCSNLNGGALFRLRHAYARLATVASGACDFSALIGQTRHPMAIDFPDVLSLSLGAPFNPYNFSPQLTLDGLFFKQLGVTFSALWQMQYASSGPEGVTNKYMNYGTVPELYAGLSYRGKTVKVVAGTEMVSIKPRYRGEYSDQGFEIWMTDRITTYSGMLYAEFHTARFTAKAKTLLSQAGEHLGLMGGYAVDGFLENDSRTYIPYRTSSSWVNLSYGDKFKFSLFGGYLKNLGTQSAPFITGTYTYYSQDCWNINDMWRVVPSVSYSMLKNHLKIGLEVEVTSARYGDVLLKDYTTGLADIDTHWVRNDRVELVVSCKF